MINSKSLLGWLLLLLIGLTVGQCPVFGAPPRPLSGQIPAGVGQWTPLGRLAATQQMVLAIGLPLRNETELDQLIQQLSDPASTNYHRYLTPDEFTTRFGPTEADYAAVRQFAETNGFTVLATHSNRLVLDVAGPAAATQRAFQVRMNNYQHPRESRQFMCPDGNPAVPANLPVVTVEGLSDYYLPHPLSRPVKPQTVKPMAGTGPSGYYAGNDFRNAYIPGTPLTGKGQTVGLLQFSSYYKSDITNYENTVGITNYVPLTDVILAGGTPSTANNSEVALDIEMAISMAPGLTRVIVYQIRNVNPGSILSRMASDNLAKQLSSSWTWSGGTSSTVESALKQMAAQGQSFFQASGDSDAYTGAQLLDDPNLSNAPVDSTNLTAVGGTTLSMNGSGVSWAGETVWNYNSYGGSYANVGSGGGVSASNTIPWWQANIDPATSQGSSTYRNVPDVALTADAVYVAYNNGSSGGMAGTSCAAPLWAGFCALINQQATASGNTNNVVGFLNPALYALATNANYTACFHDITTGNNIGTNSAGMYYATNGYDLCTGLGTPNGTNLVNALAPKPGFVTPPLSRSVIAGSNLTLTATVVGAPPISFQWRFAGTNLPDATNNVLAYTPVTTNQAGSYTLVLTNVYGAITSSVATINVGQPPVITAAPTNVVALAGSNVTFSVSAIGTSPLAYRWLKNGTNFSATATNSTLTLTAVTTNNSGNYTVVVTNLYGAVASAASLTVVQAPGLAVSSLTNRTLECSLNTNVFTATVSGTTPLSRIHAVGIKYS
jgi:subtilase family serine protease